MQRAHHDGLRARWRHGTPARPAGQDGLARIWPTRACPRHGQPVRIDPATRNAVDLSVEGVAFDRLHTGSRGLRPLAVPSGMKEHLPLGSPRPGGALAWSRAPRLGPGRPQNGRLSATSWDGAGLSGGQVRSRMCASDPRMAPA
ncbi:MAG: hypothetical protein OZSIB_3593 [Candidatus Ozemobacter sibiricus]|uniref:Uncharacterized protein n=1 Tax=Candidatus Ozemobacter sibiricus TaxID=2268124 RepID=A0A367ZQR3_9BACT|nr:MAG: hypothetical protein OZSIB_3593 [Candidatus Ozemobacter sibiricus]